ncbi:hypothetical protein V8G54_036314 [Vigna mungo]|uniref:Apple domain-containing protein n=1 Tax=Vigna mungo TaxID=3915 RepID=A0AAQ3MH53_VIGMU
MADLRFPLGDEAPLPLHLSLRCTVLPRRGLQFLRTRHRDELLTADDVLLGALRAGQVVLVKQPIEVLTDVLVQAGDSMPGSRTLQGFRVCIGEAFNICECVSGFEPLDGQGWGSTDYCQGCHCVDAWCDGDDGFEDLGAVRFGFGNMSLVKGKSRSFCERECLGDCGCVGLSFEK